MREDNGVHASETTTPNTHLETTPVENGTGIDREGERGRGKEARTTDPRRPTSIHPSLHPPLHTAKRMILLTSEEDDQPV